MATQLAQVTAINERLNKIGQKLGITVTQSVEASGAIKFSVNLDLGSFYRNGFLQENLGYIQKVLKPLDPVVKFLTTEIPFVSDYKQVVNVVNRDSNPSSISVLDILGFAAELKGNKIDFRLIDDVLSINRLISNLPRSGEKISLGEFKIDASGAIDNSGLKLNLSLPKPKLPSGFEIPLLSDPGSTIFGILQGQTKSLFDYTAPEFKLNINGFAQSVPVIPPLGVTIRGDLNVSAQLGFGFDTFGFQQGQSFGNGFYIKDFKDSEVRISPKLGVGPAITVSAASLDATLGVGPDIEFDLNDPTPGDGQIRFSEITSFDTIFKKPQIGLSADLRADIRILGTSILGLESPPLGISLGEFPPAVIENKIDEILGYVKQIQDLASGKAVARFLKNSPEFTKDKADQFGSWSRETADRFGGFVEEQYKNGVQVLKRTWDIAENFVEETFSSAGKRIGQLVQSGGRLVSTVFDGATQVSETIWQGTQTIFKKGGEEIEWVGGKLRSIVRGSARTLFNAAGNVVDAAGNVIQSGADFFKGVANSVGGTVGGAVKDFFSGGLFLTDSDGGEPFKPSRTRPTSSGITYRPDGSILIQSEGGADFLEGTEQNDEIRAGEGDDYIAGNGGQDALYGEGGNDFLDGGTGLDILNGGAGNDTIKGGAGSDKDFLFGAGGDDILDGEQGDDELYGLDGNDQLFSSTGFDLLNGGANIDTAHYDNDPGFVIVNLDSTQNYSNTAYPSDLEPTFDAVAGKAWDGFGDVDSLREVENITGSAFNDVLIGDGLSNTLRGLDGDDLLIGNGGDDTLDGGDGIDTISYRRSANSANIGISVDLSTNIGFDGIDGLDTLRNIENIIGSRFADRIIGDNQDNIILGGDGNDIITGYGGNDRLFGENGEDQIFGGSGDDFLIGDWFRQFADTLNGDSGIDTASYLTSLYGVAASLAAGTGWLGDATGDKFISIENLEGSNSDDFLIGDNGDNTLTGLSGNDTLQGEDGDDQLVGGSGNNTLRGGRGDDALYGNNDNDILDGGEGNDYLDGGTGTNVLNAGEGNNTIFAADGSNTVYAGAGADLVTLGNGSNTVYTGEGRGFITLGNGNNKVYGGSDTDIIFIGNGSNEIYAGEGENNITAGSGDDLVYGGSLADIINAGSGTNRIFAGEGNNIVITETGSDIVYTGAGSDFISTGSSDDVIYAGEGANWINAGVGNNTLYSGSGCDLFILNAGEGFDLIKNFEIGKDKLGLIGELKQDQLTVTQVNSGRSFFTEISISGSGDILARLDWTQACRLTGNSFMPNLPSSNSSLLSLFG